MYGSSQSGLPLSQKRCTLCTSKFDVANVLKTNVLKHATSTDYRHAKGGLTISHLIIENTLLIFFYTQQSVEISIAKETRYRVPSVVYRQRRCYCCSKTEILNIFIKVKANFIAASYSNY